LFLQGVQEDIKTLQQNVNNINGLQEQLLNEADTNFANRTQSDVKILNEKWSKLVMLAQEQNSRLKVALQYSQDMHEQIKVITDWLEPIKEDLAHKDYAVNNSNDLHVKNKKFMVCTKIDETKNKR